MKLEKCVVILAYVLAAHLHDYIFGERKMKKEMKSD